MAIGDYKWQLTLIVYFNRHDRNIISVIISKHYHKTRIHKCDTLPFIFIQCTNSSVIIIDTLKYPNIIDTISIPKNLNSESQ